MNWVKAVGLAWGWFHRDQRRHRLTRYRANVACARILMVLGPEYMPFVEPPTEKFAVPSPRVVVDLDSRRATVLARSEADAFFSPGVRVPPFLREAA